MIYIAFDLKFCSLLCVSVLSSIVTGSTLQWVHDHGKLSWENQYNLIVTIAAVSSLIQTVGCFINVIMAPDINLPYLVYILFNWVIMTHSSVMLVSKKLALTFLKPKQQNVWRRLLLINLCMMPISLFICICYATSNTTMGSDTFIAINKITEPIQITLWGIIEFCLSGAFIVQMWKYHWTAVERRSIYVLVLVAACDTVSVLLNLFIGDLESTCVKGLVYALRIRLEVSVLDQMVNYVRSRRNPPLPPGSAAARSNPNNINNNNNRSLLRIRESSVGGAGRVPGTNSWVMFSPSMFHPSEYEYPAVTTTAPAPIMLNHHRRADIVDRAEEEEEEEDDAPAVDPEKFWRIPIASEVSGNKRIKEESRTASRTASTSDSEGSFSSQNIKGSGDGNVCNGNVCNGNGSLGDDDDDDDESEYVA